MAFVWPPFGIRGLEKRNEEEGTRDHYHLVIGLISDGLVTM